MDTRRYATAKRRPSGEYFCSHRNGAFWCGLFAFILEFRKTKYNGRLRGDAQVVVYPNILAPRLAHYAPLPAHHGTTLQHDPQSHEDSNGASSNPGASNSFAGPRNGVEIARGLDSNPATHSGDDRHDSHAQSENSKFQAHRTIDFGFY